jgi:hypothetical protein
MIAAHPAANKNMVALTLNKLDMAMLDLPPAAAETAMPLADMVVVVVAAAAVGETAVMGGEMAVAVMVVVLVLVGSMRVPVAGDLLEVVAVGL